jgi:hypothetical protein
MKATKAHPLSDRERGHRDGLNGSDPREAGGNYLAGYTAGQEQREERHRRLDEVCERWRRLLLA